MTHFSGYKKTLPTNQVRESTVFFMEYPSSEKPFQGGCMNARLSYYPAGVFASQEPPCMSVYQKTHRHHPENQQDPIRFRNLVKKLEESLSKKYPKKEVMPLLSPFYRLADDHRFWNHTLDGLAVFGAPGMFRVYRLQESVKDFAVVSESFHTKPLVRIFQSYERFQVLSLTRSAIRLYEGTKDALDEIPLGEEIPATMIEALGDLVTAPHQTVASYGKGVKGPAMHHGHGVRKDESEIDAVRFFRIVDKGVFDHHSQTTGLPLLLVALPENQGLFRQISQNPYLMKDGIDMNPDALANGMMHSKAWKVFEPQSRSRFNALIDEYGDALSKGLGSGDLEEVARAAVSGKISKLFIDNDFQVPGRLNRATGTFSPDDLDNPDIGDLLDDIGELVLQKGGNVHVVHSERMPSNTGIAAVFRF